MAFARGYFSSIFEDGLFPRRKLFTTLAATSGVRLRYLSKNPSVPRINPLTGFGFVERKLMLESASVCMETLLTILYVDFTDLNVRFTREGRLFPRSGMRISWLNFPIEYIIKARVLDKLYCICLLFRHSNVKL